MANVRGRESELTALLTVVSLALVFGAALGTIPASVLPRAPDGVVSLIPHVNAALSALAIGGIAVGIRAIKRGEVGRHRRAMVTTFGLFVAFLVLYLYRIVLEGPSDFAGPAVVERFVYLPLLGIHILLAIAAVPAVYYTLLVAASYPVSELPRTNHPRAGKVAAGLWLVSFTLGIVVYLMLYVVY